MGWPGYRWRLPSGPLASALIVAAAGWSGASTVGAATGAPLVDRLLRGGVAAAAAAAAATAPTWAVVVLATSAGALGWAGGPLASGSGVAGLVLALVLVGRLDGHRHLLKQSSAALAATALLRVPGGPLGATAAATGALTALIVLTGLRRGGRRWRRRSMLAGAALVGVGSLAGVLGVAGALSARSSFERSSTRVDAALDAARAGDGAKAAESAGLASADLADARSSLRAWWAKPGWTVPILGAHLRAADHVASSAGQAVEAAAGSVGGLRLDVLRPASGRLDLERLSAAEPELARLSAALDTAQRRATRARSPWLVAPVEERLETYDAELADVKVATDRALLAVRTLPELLGRDRPTRWFVAVANPAETRELGGFLGDYVVIVADKGSVRLERSGAVGDLDGPRRGRTLTGVDLPDRYLSQRPELYWENLTGYPDLPTVASAARALWDQVAPGSPLDGVAYVDPHGLAALLRLTGPVRAPAPLGTLNADNAAQLLLTEQYARFDVRDKRKDALRAVADATFTTLSSAPLPAPAAIGAALGPAARGGHLVATSFSPEGQRLFDEVGASGRLPVASGGDLASLRTTNLLANKLDAHLRRSVRYQAVVDPDSRRVAATATLELRSEADVSLPDYVAANRRGLPKATDLLEVAWYSGLELQGIEVDGRAVPALSDRERGWWTHSTKIEVPPGGVITVVIRLEGELTATRPYELAVAPQAAAQDDRYSIEVTGTSGWSAGRLQQPRPGQRTDLSVVMRPR